MSLEFRSIAAQIDDMGRVLAQRADRQRQALPAAQVLLGQFARDHDRLRDVADSEAGQRLRCASPGPGPEPLDGSTPAPPMPDRTCLVATDGSQIYPDSHGLAFYYAINVGGIVFRHGTGQAPDVITRSQLHYAEDQVYPGGVPVTGDLVSAERDLREMQELAGLSSAEPLSGPPCLSVVDGPLLIWLQRAGVSEDRRSIILADYLDCFDRLEAGGVALAGFVSRPRSAEVVALLYLAQLAPEERDAVNSLAETSFQGLTDRALFGCLDPGHRSSLFVRGTADNRDFRDRGHLVHFFYLKTDTDVARVEVPEWVACSPDKLELVHAALNDQCRLNKGYPYILTRADEQAVILAEEREMLETMMVRAMMSHGLPPPECSPKAQQKKVARWRSRR